MFRRIRSYCLFGIKAVPVSVEVDASQGLPGFTLVGLPDNAVRESRERVISAIRSVDKVVTGFRTTVNLSPADLRKEGSALDLPLAMGLLTATGEIEVPDLEHLVFVGELSLDGQLKPIRGVLSFAMSLSEKSRDILVIPRANEEEASLVEGIRYVCADTLKECVEKMESGAANSALSAKGFKDKKQYLNTPHDIPDFKNVVGMEGVKRALEIAAAGAHNFLLVGSPGAGKTLCAKCLPGILPEMTELEILETSRIHSCARSAGEAEDFKPVMVRPFRTPHHSASMVSLVGGGTRLKPGEASLAHNGVLFLDELPEFNRSVLEALREPMEEGQISISRASGTVTWPARFMMGAAMNPCLGTAPGPHRHPSERTARRSLAIRQDDPRRVFGGNTQAYLRRPGNSAQAVRKHPVQDERRNVFGLCQKQLQAIGRNRKIRHQRRRQNGTERPRLLPTIKGRQNHCRPSKFRFS